MPPCKAFVSGEEEQPANENAKNNLAAAMETHADQGFGGRRCQQDDGRGPHAELDCGATPGEHGTNRDGHSNLPNQVEFKPVGNRADGDRDYDANDSASYAPSDCGENPRFTVLRTDKRKNACPERMRKPHGSD